MSGRVRLRHVAEINPSTPEFERLPNDADVTFLPLEAVWPGSWLDTSRRRPKSDVALGYTRFREGDVLLPKITPTFEGDRSTVVRGLKHGVGAGTTELHIIRPGTEAIGRYICYLLSSRPFLLGGEAEMIGVAGQKRVPDRWLRNYQVPVLGLAKQRVIADFLDAETARIDAVIAKKERVVKLLRERELAAQDLNVGSHVGVSGMGVPSLLGTHQMVRLGAVSTVHSGLTVDGGRPLDGSAARRPYLSVANVQDGHLDLSTVKEVTLSRLAMSRFELKYGDVLMTEGGDPDKLGRGTVWRDEIAGCLHQNHIFAVRPSYALLSDFLALVTRSSYARAYFETTASKTTGIASTSTTKISSFRIPLPDLDEQQRIIRSALERSKNITTAVLLAQRQIDLLREHRRALITAAVTGEIEVPGMAHAEARD